MNFLLSLLPAALGLIVWLFGARYWADLSIYRFPILPYSVGFSLVLIGYQARSLTVSAWLRLCAGFAFNLAPWFALYPMADFLWRSLRDVWINGQVYDLGTAITQTLSGLDQWKAGLISGGVVTITLIGTWVAGMLLAGIPLRRPLLTDPWRQIWNPRQAAADAPHKGAWLSDELQRQLVKNKTGLPLGLISGALARYLPKKGEWLEGFATVLAATRAGKGVSCVIPALLDHPGGTISIDIKAELAQTCSGYRASTGRRQLFLDPFRELGAAPAQFNPLSYVRMDQKTRDITVLTEGLIPDEAEQATQWIADDARLALGAAIELVLDEPPENRNLVVVRDLLLGPNKLATFSAWAEAGDLYGGRLAEAGAKLTGYDDKQKGIIFGALDNALKWLRHDETRAMVQGGTFTLEELLEGRADLYLIVPLDILSDMNGFFRLFMYLALGAATRAGLARKTQPQLLMIFDEFTRLGRMTKVLDIATVAAGLNINGIFVVQDLGAFKDTYGDNGARTIISASATTRIFALGRGDDITAEWLERVMPKKTIVTRSAQEGNDTAQRGEAPAPLISAVEILELPADEMICLIRSHAPLKLKQIVSYEHPAYKKRMNLPLP